MGRIVLKMFIHIMFIHIFTIQKIEHGARFQFGMIFESHIFFIRKIF